MVRSTLIAVALMAAAQVATPAVADACSCLPPDIARSYNYATDVVKVTVLRTLRRAPPNRVRYLARVHEAFKGCLQHRDRVILETASSSAACGMHLERRGTYLINGTRPPVIAASARPVLSIHSCDYNRRFGDLTDADLEFLYSRYNCCKGECVCTDGSQPVNCFVDPCQVSRCDVPGAECVSNYCGGCNAEWYDEMGTRVCDGEDACLTDDDCAADTWCRPNEAGVGECVPFSGPGGSCNGYVLPWTRERCEPGLICVPQEPTGDIPGTCAACSYDGMPYQAGDSFPSTDGCNSCTCFEGGMIACTLRACFPLECAPGECGPPLGMPNYLCPDGVTVAGPGDCVRNEEGICGWEIVTCPDECTPRECGPRPLMPNYLCPDGETVAGPGPCVRNADGICGWEIVTCPDRPVPCGHTLCEPGLVCCNASCGICTPPDGFCTQQACLPVECTPQECGPAPGMPNYLCPDGVSVAGPGDCVRHPNGVCGWEILACPSEGEACGGVTCPAGTSCCNASCGICTPPGMACIQIACEGPITALQ